MKEIYFDQIGQMCKKLYAAGLNIDYYPTNFLVMNDILYYVDYECNNYMDEWNFENWGIKYWSKTEEFVKAFGEQILNLCWYEILWKFHADITSF